RMLFGRFLAMALALGVCAVPAAAAPHEARVTLHEGKLRLGDLSTALVNGLHLSKLHIPPLKGQIDLRSWGESNFVGAINGALGDARRAGVAGEAAERRGIPDRLLRLSRRWADRGERRIAGPKRGRAARAVPESAPGHHRAQHGLAGVARVRGGAGLCRRDRS